MEIEKDPVLLYAKTLPGFNEEQFTGCYCGVSDSGNPIFIAIPYGQVYYEVTHWMPLPEPPKEKEQ